MTSLEFPTKPGGPTERTMAAFRPLAGAGLAAGKVGQMTAAHALVGQVAQVPGAHLVRGGDHE